MSGGDAASARSMNEPYYETSRAAERAFYAAFQRANLEEMMQVWADEDSIMCIHPMGPRLEDQKTELSRLLKRAATPLVVEFVSDNATRVSVFKIGQFGTFAVRQLELLPGNYVAVGIRPGYRDVRVEFRVAPEIDMAPIVVQCEEPI